MNAYTEILPPEAPFTPGLPGITWTGLHEASGLMALTQAFYRHLEQQDPTLNARLEAWHGGQPLAPPELSRLLLAVAPHLSAFLGTLFGIELELASLKQSLVREQALFRFKGDFVSRRVFRRGREPLAPDPARQALVEWLFTQVPGTAGCDEELAMGVLVDHFCQLEKEYVHRLAMRDPRPVSEASRAWVRNLRTALQGLSALPEALAAVVTAGAQTDDADQPDEALVVAILGELERELAARWQTPAGQARLKTWLSFNLPKNLDFQALVELERPDSQLPERLEGRATDRRRREGFDLTDPPGPARPVMDQVHYCLYCHDRERDSCSKGLAQKGGGFKTNPLGTSLAGCPLHEKISEFQLLMQQGDPLASLCVVTVDNPMTPGTGHRICNDCMKACVYQKQEPVDIPRVETAMLRMVLELPWGFELWSLLTRWNPLRQGRPAPALYHGHQVLVVGLGPAGYTLAHHLLNEGFGVVGIDGLKIEPLPLELVGSPDQPPRPIRDIRPYFGPLSERMLAGFGGVSEYGITVRWDKNFLFLLHLNLARRTHMRIFGGVRFGGTLSLEDAWALGFDHVALATGAGKPTLIDMPHKLARGIRAASDFLMGLQLTGAFKRDSIANLQVQLPALVLGGGLTAVDTATELMAFYIAQVEKMLARHEALVQGQGQEAVLPSLDQEERETLETFLSHGRAVREERARALAAGEKPDFARLVDGWGGVSVVYRKSLQDSPAYRLNHEEVAKGLEEGIRYLECLNPVEALIDARGAVSGVRFERQVQEEGRWRSSGVSVTLPARSVFMAAGTSPNIVPEKERPGTFALDARGQFFKAHTVVKEEGGLRLQESTARETGFLTSYRYDPPQGGQPRFVSFYGDNHPRYNGNVVKAMASAKDGYKQVVAIFEGQLEVDEETSQVLDAGYQALIQHLEASLTATVQQVSRLTPSIVEVVVKAPLAARHFEPGQFFRLQNLERDARHAKDTRLSMEGLALTGAWVDKEAGLLSLIVLEMGASSRLCATLEVGQQVVVMGPTGAPTEIPSGQTVLLAGGGLGNAVLFSIARALKDKGNRVLYFAGYKHSGDVFKREALEEATDILVWAWDQGPAIMPAREADRAWQGNIVSALQAYAEGRLGEVRISLGEVDRIIAIGSDRMMAAVRDARHGVLKPWLKACHEAIGSINSPMQCMMKEVCAQCLQRQVDPDTGEERVVFSCFNQDQNLDHVDFANLQQRLRTNSVQEKLTNQWLDWVL